MFGLNLESGAHFVFFKKITNRTHNLPVLVSCTACCDASPEADKVCSLR